MPTTSSVFHADRVCLDALWPDLHSRITVWVSPEDDIEFRRVELNNLGQLPIEIDLISAFEPTLSDPRADEAHPAFGNLFVKAHSDWGQQALLFERKPRLATEAGLHMAHFVAESGPQLRGLSHQVDRQRWLGRNRASWSPRADLQAWQIRASGIDDSGAQVLDTGLDPMCALGLRLVITPGVPVRLTLATAASGDACTLRAVIDKYRQPSHIERALLMSATLAGIRLHTLRIGASTYTTAQTLTTALMFTLSRPPAAGAQRRDRRVLWRFGISGDRPIVLVSVAGIAGLGLVRSLNQALSLWSWGGVACDLVVVNTEPASYEMALQRELASLRDRHDGDAAARASQAPSGWHLLRTDDLSADELGTLQCLARLRLQADGRSLAHHLNEWASQHEEALQLRHETSHTALSAGAWLASAPAPSQGLFAEHLPGRAGEFSFDVSSGQRPSRPWVNVMANAGFGSQLSEAGGGMSWAVNSRMNQLTPWSNDPVSDTPGEWLLLQDLRSHEVWSLTPSAWGAAGVVYRVVHGQGDSLIRHKLGDLEVTATWCVDPVTAVKQVHVSVVNRGQRTRQLRLVAMAEWLLGSQRSDRAGVSTLPDHQATPGACLIVLLATQQEQSAGFGGGTAFLAAIDPELGDTGAQDLSATWGDARDLIEPGRPGDWTCDRREFFDARGHPVLPDHLGRQHGNADDPCAALALRLSVPSGDAAERTLLLGWAPSPALASQLAVSAAVEQPGERLRAARAMWDQLLGATEVHTPDPLFDAMVNRWLLYQGVSCRLWAKAGFYQAGGATGFRDQLQDAMALAWTAPHLLREQIVRCASRQFVEGDVQHWWHDPLGAGVRTHFSDDLVWLPYALAYYLHRTGDAGVLDEPVAFIEGLVIPAGAEDIYGTPGISAAVESVYEHARAHST
ncbi:MAG: hypothetical protein IPG93_20955 [Burkholderiales bacterium]|nr:hypothetical protein [Burkholderiales bacterium]